VPFIAFFPAGRADPSLIGRLTSQGNLQGLLRGAVGGLQSVMRRGSFTMPPSVLAATARFKAEADPMRGFMEDVVSFHHQNDPRFTPRTDLYTAYSMWSARNGFQAMSAQRFYESFAASAVGVSEFPVRVITRGGTRGYGGIAVDMK
jgi:phage/plasmid-associated DNA primase